jgi:arsenical pump membrane protein
VTTSRPTNGSRTEANLTDDRPKTAKGRLDLVLGGLGVALLTAAVIAQPTSARSAASQDWPPFVLVTGLLLIGLVANRDGLFAAAGYRLSRLCGSGAALFAGAVVMVGVVTAVLNLDTSVAFLTPVLVYTARSRGGGEAPLLYGCLLWSNAGSLFLPGSNLTNLIVLGHLHLTGASFFSRMWAPALAALLVTALVVAVFERRALALGPGEPGEAPHPSFGLGLIAIVAATALIVVLSAPALPVAAVGVAVVGIRLITGKQSWREVAEVLGMPVLIGLFGVAVALGTLGRQWSGPAVLISHLGSWGTAAVAAAGSVLVNNLPAASLLAARRPERPLSLLIGLDLGPNLFVTGSLAWLLWLRAARSAGARPSIATAARIGWVAVPLSMAAALGMLSLGSFR